MSMIKTTSVIGSNYHNDNTNQSVGQIDGDSKIDEILLMEDNTYQDFSNNTNNINNMLYKNSNSMHIPDEYKSH